MNSADSKEAKEAVELSSAVSSRDENKPTSENSQEIESRTQSDSESSSSSESSNSGHGWQKRIIKGRQESMFGITVIAIRQFLKLYIEIAIEVKNNGGEECVMEI